MVLTSFLAGFLRDGDFFGIPTLKTSATVSYRSCGP